MKNFHEISRQILMVKEEVENDFEINSNIRNYIVGSMDLTLKYLNMTIEGASPVPPAVPVSCTNQNCPWKEPVCPICKSNLKIGL